MRKPFKRMIAAVMTIVVIALSIITAFAVEYDPVQNKSYSYSEKGDCTVNNSGVVWVSSNYTYTHRYTVNGKIATCSWSTNNSPDDGTYTNATKYYLNNGSLRAKAFYWLYLDNDASISDNRAKYDSSSKTYWDDICNALDDAGATGAYAFVHSVIDYMQQGSLNPYCDDDWNDVVVDFIDHIDYYPDVPKEYRIFYFYPQGNAAQSLMSWENTPHGYIKVIKASSDTSISNGNSIIRSRILSIMSPRVKPTLIQAVITILVISSLMPRVKVNLRMAAVRRSAFYRPVLITSKRATFPTVTVTRETILFIR